MSAHFIRDWLLKVPQQVGPGHCALSWPQWLSPLKGGWGSISRQSQVPWVRNLPPHLQLPAPGTSRFSLLSLALMGSMHLSNKVHKVSLQKLKANVFRVTNTCKAAISYGINLSLLVQSQTRSLSFLFILLLLPKIE